MSAPDRNSDVLLTADVLQSIGRWLLRGYLILYRRIGLFCCCGKTTLWQRSNRAYCRVGNSFLWMGTAAKGGLWSFGRDCFWPASAVQCTSAVDRLNAQL